MVTLVAGEPLGLGLIEIVLGLLGVLIAVPLIFSVAIWGHAPRWWNSVEKMIDMEKALQRHAEKRDRKD